MPEILGHTFYTNRSASQKAYPDGKFFARHGLDLFSGFDSHEEFHAWYRKYMNHCDNTRSVNEFHEEVIPGQTNAFYSDIEAYAPKKLSKEEVSHLETVIIDSVERCMRILYPHVTNRGAWSGDHRVYSKENEPDRKFKISLHYVCNDLLHVDADSGGVIASVAKDLDKMVMADIGESDDKLFNSMDIPKGQLFDMSVYRSKGCVRGIYGAKKNSKNSCFKPIGEVMPIADYLITKDILPENIPDEIVMKHSPLSKKLSCPAKSRSLVQRGDTRRVTTDPATFGPLASAIIDHVRSKGDKMSFIAPETAPLFTTYGNRYFYLTGERRCLLCKDETHASNRAKVTYYGNGKFKYSCLANKGPTYDFVDNGLFELEREARTERNIIQDVLGMLVEGVKTRAVLDLKEEEEEPDAMDVDPFPFGFAGYFSSAAEEPVPVNKKKRKLSDDNRFISSFNHVTSKCIIIKAPMGTGKTTATMNFIKSRGVDLSVLWITPRRTMAMCISGKYGFDLYTASMNGHRQVVEYESLHKNRMIYDIIILDEIRSLCKTFVSTVTNRDMMMEHMRVLKELCSNSHHTIMLDADIDIDGSVETFATDLYEKEDIHRINHETGSMELEAEFLNPVQIKERMMQDLREGKRVAVCHGSRTQLELMEKEVGELIGHDKVAAYYRDSGNHKDLMDVNTNWANKQFIGYTSTITVSVSYEGCIDRAYLFPYAKSTSPREMIQMLARMRCLLNRVFYVMTTTGDVEPHSHDTGAMYEDRLNDLIEKRKEARDHHTSMERAYYSTIMMEVVDRRYVYTPHVLTKIAAWSMVEDDLKVNSWYPEFTKILRNKSFGWSMRSYEPLEEEEDVSQGMTEDMMKEAVSKEHMEHMERWRMDMCEARFLTGPQTGLLMWARKTNKMTSSDVIMINKLEVQKYFKGRLGYDDVQFLRVRMGAVRNSILFKRLGSKVTLKIMLNSESMGMLEEFNKGEAYIVRDLLSILETCGVKGVFDTKSKIDLESNKEKILNLVGSIDRQALRTRCRSKTLKGRIGFYLNKYMGVDVVGAKEYVDGKQPTVYRLRIMYPGWLERDTVIGTDDWVRKEFAKYDKFCSQKEGTEYKNVLSVLTEAPWLQK